MSALYLYRSGSIQDKIIQTITNKISDKYGAELSIGSSEMSFEDGIQLKNILLNDHHKDTLLFVRNINTSLNSLDKVFEGDINFSNIYLDGMILNVKDYSSDKINNAEFFLNLIRSKIDSTKLLPIITFSSVSIKNSELRMPKINSPIKITNLKLTDLISAPDYFYSNSFNAEFKLDKVDDLFINLELFEYMGCSILINEYSVFSNKSEFHGNLSYIAEKGNLLNSIENPKIKSNLKLTNFEPSRFGFKTDSLKIIEAEFNIEGSIDSLEIKKAKLDLGYSKIEAEFNVLNLFSKKENVYSGNFLINNFKINDLDYISKSIPNIEYLRNQKINNLKLNGTYSRKFWNLNLDINSSFGNFETFLQNDQFNQDLSSINIIVKQLNFSKFNKSIPQGFLSGNIKFNKNDTIVRWHLQKAEFISETIEPIYITANGFNDNNKGNIFWKASGGLDIFSSTVEYDFSTKVNKLSSVIDLKSFDLSVFNKNIGGGKADLSGVFKSKIEAETLDKASIILIVQNLNLNHNKGVLSSSDFYVNSILDDGKRNFSIINSSWLSGEATGKFDLSKISLLINNTFAETFPIIPKFKLNNNQEINFDFKLSKDLVNVLNSDIQSKEDFNLKGYLNNEEFKSYLDIEIPFFQYRDFYAQGLKININNKSFNRDSKLIIDKLIYKNSNLGDFSISSRTNNDKLTVNTKLKSLFDNEYLIDLNFDFDKITKDKSVFYFTESSILFNDHKWKIEGLEKEPITYDFVNSSIEINNFKIFSEKSQFKISGFYRNPDNFDIAFNIKDFEIHKFLNQYKNLTASGSFNSKFNISRSLNNNSLDGFLKSTPLRIDDNILGIVDLKITGNTQTKSYLIDWHLKNNQEKTFSAIGNLFIESNKPKVDLDISFSDFDISFVSSFLKKSISNVYGSLKGDLNIWGESNNLQGTGLINLSDSGFTIPYINTNYSIENTSEIKFYNNVLEFTSTKIFDDYFKTNANIEAKFTHSNFRDWNVNLTASSDRIFILNKKKTEQALFYGDGFFSGDILLKGPTKMPQLKLVGKTAKGTSLKIPWKDTKEISDISFIKFEDKKTKINYDQPKKIDSQITSLRGLEMFFELDIDNSANVEIVIDQSSGSYISGKGIGKLLMETNTNGKFNMWGDFYTSEGVYNFKNLGIIDKKFNLEPGGSIVWDGSPTGAQMNLNALYEVPGGANPSILLDNPNFNKKIPTQVGINLQGDLLKPDNPIFEIFFPNTNATVVSEIKYRLADPQISQLQAISLLSQGMFVNDVSLSIQGITNNLYEKASDLFNSIIGQNDEKLKVGINYLKGDRNSNLDVFSEDRLGLTLSTQVSDKILINGKIGVPVGGVNETLIVGDVQIDFILNEDGSLRAKVFNKENEFRYIGDKIGYTQGMGLSYNVDFNYFKELISKIINDAK